MCLIDKINKTLGLEPSKNPKKKKPVTRKRAVRKGMIKPKETGTHTFIIQKPICCPAEPIIVDALRPRGVPILEYAESYTGTSLKDLVKRYKIGVKEHEKLGSVLAATGAIAFMNESIEARVVVPKAQAEWAEYLLESTCKLLIVKGRINKKNRTWGERRNGELPTPWDPIMGITSATRREQLVRPSSGPWIEPSCAEGKKAWAKVNQAIQASSKLTKPKR